jgi:hypothetical protein
VTKAKLLDFKAKISDVKNLNPSFSTCSVRILYTGRNRNMSLITKNAVKKALPSLVGIPIVGEYSVDANDFKGHGGQIDADTYKYIHTTKPYGFVPESADYSWEEVKGRDGTTREYLRIDGCILWTGRYEEAYDVITKGKGQSMEIEVSEGQWLDDEDVYQIDNFIFTALCVLGDDVEPAFEDANIRAYSINKDSFNAEFNTMRKEFDKSLSSKEGNDMLKELLEKYSLTMEDITAKNIAVNELSIEELEAKIIEVFEIQDNVEPQAGEPQAQEPQAQEPVVEPVANEPQAQAQEPVVVEPVVEPQAQEPVVTEPTVDVDALNARIEALEADKVALEEEVVGLREYKLNAEKAEHEAKAKNVFSTFQLEDAEVESLDIHAMTIEEIEDKCYALVGRKMMEKKNFSKTNKDNSIRVQVDNDKKDEEDEKPYGNLFDLLYKNKK